MPSNDDFFASRKAAAVFKHGILKRYPVVFASKTGRDVEEHRVVFLDGYAGRGEYDGGQPGSPLLLSRCAEHVGKNRNVLGVFVEQDDDNFANLDRVLRERGGPTQRRLLHGSLDERLPEALALADGAALFAFLDPFGPALDFQTIRSRLLSRPSWPATEVLLHFSVSSVARMGGAVRAARASQRVLSQADRKTEARLNRFLGGTWWQDLLINVDEKDERRATEIAMDVADRYRKMLVDGTAFTSVSMPVRPSPDHLPKYVLVLFTRSSEGLWCFADALGRAGLEWYEAWMREPSARMEAIGQFDLFGDTPEVIFDPQRYERDNRDRWAQMIAGNIEKLLAAAPAPFTLAARVTDVYGATLGSAWEKHVKLAVKSLHAAGRISNTGVGKGFHREMNRRP